MDSSAAPRAALAAATERQSGLSSGVVLLWRVIMRPGYATRGFYSGRMAPLVWHGNDRPPRVEWHNRSAELLGHLAAWAIDARINEGAVRGLIAQLGPGRKRAMLARTQKRSDCKTTGTMTVALCRYPSGQPRPTRRGEEAAAADLVMKRALGFVNRLRRERATLARTQQP